MPTHFQDDGEDGLTPVVQFDPSCEISPFFLFRRLKGGQEIRLVDVRPAEARDAPRALTLAGAEAWPGEDWEPPDDAEAVLFDEDGGRSVELARAYQARGFYSVRALFGGLDLYRFALDPEIVGAETFLVTRG